LSIYQKHYKSSLWEPIKTETTEKLEDWADRLLSLATKAFRDLPEEHVYSQAIWRFCQGCYDKEAGQHAAMSRPKSMEEAIDKIKWYQHTTRAIYGKPIGRREFPADSDDDIESVRTVKAAGKGEKQSFPLRQDSDKLQSMEAQIKILVDSMQMLQTKLQSMETKPKPRPYNKETRTCFNCNKQGHLAKDCRKPKKSTTQQNDRRNTNGTSDTRPLNGNGSGQQA
jgi:hypothetical protein